MDPEKRRRFVLACQQLLVVGTVVAVLVPASSVVTLDIVAPGAPAARRHGAHGGVPAGSNDAAVGTARSGTAGSGTAGSGTAGSGTAGSGTAGSGTAGSGTAGQPSATGTLVAVEPVRPTVTEVPMPGVDRVALRSAQGAARGAAPGLRDLAALTAPEPVHGMATVGVTWAHGVHVPRRAITVWVRTRDHAAWSRWQRMPYDAEHGPDPGTAEARRARPGTDAVIVGRVDEVQVKAMTASGRAPVGMRLALVDPGAAPVRRVQRPAIDTARLSSAASTSSDVTPRPTILSRAQWGADESMRDKPSLHYGEVHAGFVHHTVDANRYTRAEVPAIIRGIYAFHTRVRGWSDIGYNFLVDRFGRIWEGRYGGVDRPVVGAHTLHYNEYSFAMSAIGDYDIRRPSSVMVDAFARLFAWKLSLHGVRADSTRQWVGSRWFKAVSGHRDANPTACPGRYLYAQLPSIRRAAARYQHPFAGRQKSANLGGTRWPDLVVRDKVTGEAYVVHTGGQVGFRGPRVAATGWKGMDLITPVGDVTGDGRPDVVARAASTGVTSVYPGDRAGRLGAPVKPMRRLAGMNQLVGVGDLDGDGHPDLLGRDAATSVLYLFPGQGRGRFGARVRVSGSWGRYDATVAAGDLTGDRRVDVLARDRSGTLWLFPGNGRGGLRARTALPGRWGGFDLLAGMGDATNDGIPDLVARAARSKVSYIYPGDGHGGLAPRYGGFKMFGSVSYLAIGGQLTGSRGADLVGRGARGSLVFYANRGTRNLGAVTDTGQRWPGSNLVRNVGDWNGDGHGDVMTRSRRHGTLYLRAGDGKGHFAAPVLAGTGWGSVGLVAAVGDITGDGNPDLMGQPSGGSMRIYPGNGASGFRPSFVAHSPISSDDQIGVGLWNRDGSPDSLLRSADGTVRVWPGNGPGGLMTAGGVVTRNAEVYDWMEGVGDVDGDGTPDVLARARATGHLWLLPRIGSALGPRRFVAAGFGGYDLLG